MNEYMVHMLGMGLNCRVWPYVDKRTGRLYVTLGMAREEREPVCELMIKDCDDSFIRLADFYAMDNRNTTTGQPYVTQHGVILVPVWDVGYYQHGKTWFAIYRSEDDGTTWTQVYRSECATYAKHFFENQQDGELYVGIGIGGGGSNGKICYAPGAACLLHSSDGGKNWKEILNIDYPTALYSGLAFGNGVILVSAREKMSIFRSDDQGVSWVEKPLGKMARNLAYIEGLNKIILSSDGLLFISSDLGKTWDRYNSPLPSLTFRYPTFCRGQIYMTSVGWRNIMISTDLKTWSIGFDFSKAVGSRHIVRLAARGDDLFLGDEMDGDMYHLAQSSMSLVPIGLLKKIQYLYHYFTWKPDNR